jgi:hypothetical protein
MALIMDDDLQLGKVSKLLGALLEQGNTASIDAALTALGQIGYDTTLLRGKIFDGTSNGILMDRRSVATGGDVETDTSLSSPSNNTVPSTQAVVTYIANLIANGTRIRGSLTLITAGVYPVADASTYPALDGTQVGNGSGSGPSIKAGDAWYVANSASYQVGPSSSNKVSKGDLIIALADGAGNVDNQWLILQNNVDLATTTIPGIVLLTTLAKLQSNAGADADAAVTTATLNSFLSNPESSDAAAKYVRRTKITQTLTNGSNTITHNKNTLSIVNVIFQNASTFANTQMGWTAATVNTITVTRTGGSQSFNIFIEY